MLLTLAFLCLLPQPCSAARQSVDFVSPMRDGLIDSLNRTHQLLFHRNDLPTPGEALAASPFYAEAQTDKAAQTFVLPFNAVYRLFGGVDREHELVFRFGNEPTYFEWNALKIVWTGDTAAVRKLKDMIVGFPQTDNGYLWSWGTSPWWPTGQGALHYDGLFRYVAAVSELVRWDGNLSLLAERDTTTFGTDRAKDASRKHSVYKKCKDAMHYAWEELGGRYGVITITERSAYLADGVTRFDRNADGVLVWNNTGRAGTTSSNYWDNLCFGHKDAYATLLYYHALLQMRDIEILRGNEAAVQKYTQHAEKVKAAFNETFWDQSKGRYIACIDADGKRWDPGLTFLNVEALAYGLGDEEKAARIFSWLDGKRTVSGDTVTGGRIMNYGPLLADAVGAKISYGFYPFAPVTNTVSIEAVSAGGEPWWESLQGAINVGEGGSAAYGHHLENGGYLFWPLYYELTARARYLGIDSVKRRVHDLARVYRFNGFNSDVGTWVEGLIGEFPENGIVSRVFVSTFCGVDAAIDALEIRPDLPRGVDKLGIETMQYAGHSFRLEVTRRTLTLTVDDVFLGILRFFPEKAGPYRVTWTAADGATHEIKTETTGGAVEWQAPETSAVFVAIEPVK